VLHSLLFEGFLDPDQKTFLFDIVLVRFSCPPLSFFSFPLGGFRLFVIATEKSLLRELGDDIGTRNFVFHIKEQDSLGLLFPLLS